MAGRTLALSRSFVRSALYAAAVGVLLGGAAGLTPQQFDVAPGSDVVTDVAIGSHAWVAGVRPGQPVAPWPTLEPVGYDVAIGDTTVGVQLRPPIELVPWLLGATITAAAAAALGVVGLPGSTAVLAAATGIAVLPVAASCGLPVGGVVALLPVALGLTAVPASRGGVLVSLGLFGAVIAGVSATALDDPWRIVWQVPVLIGALLPGAAALRAAQRLGAPSWAIVSEAVGRATPLGRRARLAAVESERQRIASEIHSVVLPRLDDTIAALDEGDRVPVRARLRGLGDDLRDLMMDRQTVILRSAGLVEALDAFAETISTPPPVVPRLSDRGRAPEAVELAAYRIAQAAVANARQHAGATTVRLIVSTSPRRVDLEVSDDGHGFSSFGRSGRRSTGLDEMGAQAEAVRGRLVVGPGMIGGVTVAFRWPA